MKWRGWFEMAGILAIIVGLGFVVLELRQSKTIAITEGGITAVEGEASIRSLIVEHADMWRRGCAGEELSEAEQIQFNQIVQLIVFLLGCLESLLCSLCQYCMFSCSPSAVFCCWYSISPLLSKVLILSLCCDLLVPFVASD